MSARPSSLERLLLRVLRQLMLVLDGALGRRIADMRARRDGVPEGHWRRARFDAELRRLARLRVLLADPDVLDDPAFLGRAAEVARVRNDAGRRALARRMLSPTAVARLAGARPVGTCLAGEGRCTTASAVADGLPGLTRAAILARVRSIGRAIGGMRRLALTDGARAASLPS